MENTPTQKTGLSAEAAATAAQRKQTETEFEQLKAIDQDLERISTLKVTNQKLRDDIAKKAAALGIQLPK